MYRNKSNPPEIEEKLKEIRAEVMKDMPKARFPSLRGWLCPKCNRGLAPHVTVCPCVPIAVDDELRWQTDLAREEYDETDEMAEY